MKRVWLLFSLASLSMLAIWPGNEMPGKLAAGQSVHSGPKESQQQPPPTTADELHRKQVEQRREAVKSARGILLSGNVPFDPDILLDPQWREKLAPVFSQMPEMKMVRHESGPLSGVYLADTLYLPEQVELAGDTVILVRHLIFKGSNAVIRGNHAIHIFPIETSKVSAGGGSQEGE